MPWYFLPLTAAVYLANSDSASPGYAADHSDDDNYCRSKQYFSACTYNVQSVNTSRPLSEVLKHVNGDIVGLQSLGIAWGTYVQRQKQQQCYFKNVGEYWVCIWPCATQAHFCNKSCGVAIAVKRSTMPRSCVSEVYSPAAECEGR